MPDLKTIIFFSKMDYILFFLIKWSIWKRIESLLLSQHYHFIYQLLSDAIKNDYFEGLSGSTKTCSNIRYTVMNPFPKGVPLGNISSC